MGGLFQYFDEKFYQQIDKIEGKERGRKNGKARSVYRKSSENVKK
ncbi:MAG: hypothetical protein QW100_00450 [Thermoplasmatales archaeon]